MENKWTDYFRELFLFSEKNKAPIVGAAVLFWVYLLAGAWGVAIFLTGLLVYGHIYTKWPLWKEPRIIEKGRTMIMPLKYAALILFLVGILFYNNNLLSEGALKAAAWISGLLILIQMALGVEDLPSNTGADIKKESSILLHYGREICRINSYCYPFFALATFFMVLALMQRWTNFWAGLNLQMVWLVSILLAIINNHTVQERVGLWGRTGKWMNGFKAFLYFFIPGYLIFNLVGRVQLKIGDYIFPTLIAVGSVWIAMEDTPFRYGGIRHLKESGRAVVAEYIRTLFRYGMIAAMLLGAYYGAAYVKNNKLFRPIQPPVEKVESPFADLNSSHWAFPALYELWKSGIMAVDADNFIQPARPVRQQELLRILFAYFDIRPEDYAENPRVSFTAIRQWDERYPLLKAGYYKGLIRRNFNPDARADKELALRWIAYLLQWTESPDDEAYLKKAMEKKLMRDAAPSVLKAELNRAALAQLLFKVMN